VPAQRAAAARQARHDGADRHALNARRLGIAQPFEADEQQRLPLLARHLGERPREIAQFEPRLLVGRDRELPGRGLGGHPRAAAHVVDVNIVQDGEEPGAQVAARAPEMGTRQRARQTILHEIVDVAGITQQPPRVAAERGHVLGKRRPNHRRSILTNAARKRRGRVAFFRAPGHIPGCLAAYNVYAHASAAAAITPCVKNRAANATPQTRDDFARMSRAWGGLPARCGFRGLLRKPLTPPATSASRSR
jgi:hypothetical protein